MHIICADWSKTIARRAAVIASVDTRRVERLDGDVDLARLLAEARRRGGPTLIGIDAPLGLPASCAAALDVATFRDLLGLAARTSTFFHPVTTPSTWRPTQPFFRVPAGAGSLQAFIARARRSGVELVRDIDVATGGRSPFIVSGIPGSVGSGTIELWRELIAVLPDPALRLWPVDGVEPDFVASEPVVSSSSRSSSSPSPSSGSSSIVLAEIYPRAAYATALLPGPPPRPRLRLAKSDTTIRRDALDALRASPWVTTSSVHLDPQLLHDAQANDDVFDALLAAAALLRIALAREPWSTTLHLPHLEGGILGTGSLDLAAREQTWSSSSRTTARRR